MSSVEIHLPHLKAAEGVERVASDLLGLSGVQPAIVLTVAAPLPHYQNDKVG
jgi:hypothetical protein